MYETDGRVILSPTDLAGFLGCEHLSQLELLASRGVLTRPVRDDPMLDMLARKGHAHETDTLMHLRSEQTVVVAIPGHSSSLAGLEAAEAETVAAMREGADVIYQAAFFDGRWRGQADFLLRVEVPSNLGAWSYEVADAKLAWSIKPSARVQLSEYSLQIARLQGVQPTLMHVFLGNATVEALAVAEYAEAHLEDRRRFEETVLGAALPTSPEPVDHCGVCRWVDRCRDQWQTDDHLSLVRGMRADITRLLVDAGIRTVATLATASDEPLGGVRDETWTRLRDQARLQMRAREFGAPVYELVPADATALVMLPEPSAGDLFFDMESQPYMADGALEYLFGITEVVDGVPQYRAFWGHSPADEKVAFEALLDLVQHRRVRDHKLHVYHYAAYEVTALRKLAARHNTRQAEVERLIEDGVLVDLYAITRQSIRISLLSYSLKSVEAYYMSPRGDEVSNAGGSMVAYERWRATGDPGTLEAIRVYNERDCLSTLLLRTWLEERRTELEKETGQELPRSAPPIALSTPSALAGWPVAAPTG